MTRDLVVNARRAECGSGTGDQAPNLNREILSVSLRKQ